MKNIFRLLIKPINYTFLHLYASSLFDDFRKEFKTTQQVADKKDVFKFIYQSR